MGKGKLLNTLVIAYITVTIGSSVIGGTVILTKCIISEVGKIKTKMLNRKIRKGLENGSIRKIGEDYFKVEVTEKA